MKFTPLQQGGPSAAALPSASAFGLIKRAEEEAAPGDQELRLRQEAMALLYPVVTTANQSLDLNQCLQDALAKTLELMGLQSGWISLFEETGRATLKVHQGLSPELLEKLEDEENEEQGKALAAESVTVRPLRKGLGPRAMDPGEPPFLARVRLLSRGQGLATLNLVSPREFSSREGDLLAAIGQQVGPAIEKARLYARSRETAILEERERLGRELHDGLAQLLCCLSFQASLLERALMAGEWARAQDEVREMRKAADEAYGEVRKAILDLRSPVAPGRGLVDSVADYLNKFCRLSPMKVHLVASPKERFPLSPAAEVQVLRIIQEALTNVRKHAPGSDAWVRFQTSAEKLTVTIEDNGPGFDPVAVAQGEGKHFGLETMRERAREIGGDFILETGPGGGTRVTVVMPRQRRG